MSLVMAVIYSWMIFMAGIMLFTVLYVGFEED